MRDTLVRRRAFLGILWLIIAMVTTIDPNVVFSKLVFDLIRAAETFTGQIYAPIDPRSLPLVSARCIPTLGRSPHPRSVECKVMNR